MNKKELLIQSLTEDLIQYQDSANEVRDAIEFLKSGKQPTIKNEIVESIKTNFDQACKEYGVNLNENKSVKPEVASKNDRVGKYSEYAIVVNNEEMKQKLLDESEHIHYEMYLII